MYIRLKIFSKKSTNTFEKPINFFEVEANENTAIILLIKYLLEKQFGNHTQDKIISLVQKLNDDIKDILERE